MKNSHSINIVFLLYLLLFCFTPGRGQTEKILQQQFREYSVQALQEKLFVHTDRPFYLVGETIWFAIYAVDGSLNHPLELSKVAYVEVFDKDNNVIVQTKLTLSDAKGNGSVQLPVSLNSGYYTMRAYTQWMKNFSVDYFFEKQITIVNPFMPASAVVNETTNPSYDFQLFPEGGQLVANLESKVAFRAADSTGKGIVFAGAILNQHNDTLVHFRPTHFGIGNFIFTPVSGNTYRAVIQDRNGKTASYSLPSIQPDGYVMHVKDSIQNQVYVSISSAGALSQGIYLLIHTRQEIKKCETKKLQGGKAVFLLNKADLGEGISHFTIFNEEKQPVCERLYFKRPSKRLKIKVSPDKQAYSTREKISVDIATLSDSDRHVSADLSASIYLLDSLQTLDPNNIESYLWLTSDLKGTVESPHYYFQNESSDTDQALDNLMLTHGWSRFRWEDVLQKKTVTYSYIPEYGGHFITGKVFNAQTGLPAPHINAYLAAPGKQIQLFVAKSDSLGRFQFEVKRFSGHKEIVIQTDIRKDSLYRFEIYSPFSEKLPAHKLSSLELDRSWQHQLLTHSINMQTGNVYLPRSMPVSEPDDSIAFYGTPHEKYLLDAYTRFPTMEEVMREYVPGVMVRKQKGRFHYYSYDYIRKGVPFAEDPLILLDGVPVFDTDKIMAFDPLKIKKLETIDGRYFLGHLMFKGIVSYSTYRGDLAGFELDPRALVQAYEGMQSAKEFYSPRYETAEAKRSRLPDFRNLLYWNPAIHTDAKGKKTVELYTSDQSGVYFIITQGLTAQGVIGSNYTTIEVKGSL